MNEAIVALEVCAVGGELSCSGELCSGSSGVLKVRFHVSEEWDGYTMYAVFHDALGEPIKVSIDNEGCAFIPPDMLIGEGIIKIGIYGENGALRLSSGLCDVRVRQGAYDVGAEIYPKLEAITLTPVVEGQTVSCDFNNYDGISSVKQEAIDKLVPDNIREGVSILGVNGTFEGEKYTLTYGLIFESPYESGLPSKASLLGISSLPEPANTTLDSSLAGGILAGVADFTSDCESFESFSFNGCKFTSITLPNIKSLGGFRGATHVDVITLGSVENPVESIVNSVNPFNLSVMSIAYPDKVILYTTNGESIAALDGASFTVEYRSA